jgi:hypothetical protein
VASVAPVPDEATLDVMTQLHRRVAAGTAPHRALAATLAHLRATGAPPLTRAAAAAFLALGGTTPDRPVAAVR